MFIDIHAHAYRKLPPVHSFSTPLCVEAPVTTVTPGP
jgi:hypothetical protein